MKQGRLILLVVAALSSALCMAQNKADAIREIVNAHIAESNVAGASVAIMVDGRLQFADGFGFQDVANKIPATSHTVYRLASISKVITTAAVMQLVEQGKLDLDVDARTYATSFPAKKFVFTTRNLLTHTSGIRHYKLNKKDNGTIAYRTTEEALKLFKDDPLDYEPSTKSQYSTHAFTLVASVIEGASGKLFEDYMNENVFAKVEGDLLRFEHREHTNQYRSKLYVFNSTNGFIESTPTQDNSWKYAGGGMESSAIDLARFAQAILDGKLLKQKTVQQMWTKQKIGTLELNRGLGWVLDGQGNAQHSGSQQGSLTYLTVYRKQNTIIAVLTNTGGHNIGQLKNKVAEAWFAEEAPVKSN